MYVASCDGHQFFIRCFPTLTNWNAQTMLATTVLFSTDCSIIVRYRLGGLWVCLKHCLHPKSVLDKNPCSRQRVPRA